MKFYNRQHRHYCGIDLHVKTMYVCILDAAGQVLLHRNVPSTAEAFVQTVAPYRDDLVVAAECMFTWYWLADVCAAEGIKIDSHKIAGLLRGGLLPQAYVSSIVRLTTTTFGAPGTYELRATASDGLLETHQNFTVTVAPASQSTASR